MAIKDIYDEIKKYANSDIDLTDDYMKRINKHFNAYLKNPTDEQEDTFKRIRDALIVMWLTDLIKRIARQTVRQAKIGMSFGKQMLKQTQVKGIIKKSITSKKIKEMVKAHADKAITELNFVSNGIKVNSNRAISNIKSNFDKTKKVISTELMAEFSDYGITYYEDRLGRRQDMSYYVNRKVIDLLLNSFRDSYIAEMVRNGVEYAIVKRLPTNAKECDACIPYDNQVLAFYDNSLGYETVAEARMSGLFHFACWHYLEPVEKPIDRSDGIEHSELNNKIYNRNREKNVVKTLFS